MTTKTQKLLSLLNGQPVIPVLKIERAADAVPLAAALARGGLKAIEITLRTAEALEAIRRVAAEVEDCIVGAGTILNARQFDEAVAAGSKFIVSPGVTRELLAAAARQRRAVPARRDHAERDHGRARGGPRFPEILPRRAGRGCSLPQGARLAHRRRQVLPDGRHLGEECNGLSQPAQRRLRRRLLGRPRRHGQGRRLGRASKRWPPRRASCARTERANLPPRAGGSRPRSKTSKQKSRAGLPARLFR